MRVRPFVLLPLAVLLAGAVPAGAAAEGGQSAPPAYSATGGAGYGQAIGGDVLVRAVASRFSVAPRTLVAGRDVPHIALRVTQPGGRLVTVRVAFRALHGQGTTVSVPLGRVAVNTTLSPAWPTSSALAPGRYVVSVHATDSDGRALARTGQAAGRTTLTVKAAPVREPAATTTAPAPTATTVTTPVTPTAAAPAPSPVTAGTFPVQGSYRWGDPFGVLRPGWTHQGQDLAAASGTPVVAPVAGTITTTANQPSAAGYYVVLTDAAGRGMFFAHCLAGSFAVRAGQAVAQGAPLCAVGATGDATGPHLHFELWPNGWRTSAAAEPVDPAPQLRAWEG